ncbi:hypothetical protein K2173_001227 [Erythroxylum novogranatense]|uniref:Uncharacterized protein n=1 Tax=Erythroxylum novogranatense TaxID=1862640 RepID=A0AAV8T342_9ROSI|nr:hypothetical protein K2173_001227 [Erythroxylum novogranatense]
MVSSTAKPFNLYTHRHKTQFLPLQNPRFCSQHHVSFLPVVSSSLGFNPLRLWIKSNDFGVMVVKKNEKKKINKKGRGFSAVCYASPLSPQTLQWITTVSSAVLMLTRGTAIHKSFLIPLFALQAPPDLISWIKGDYGIWTVFLALLLRLFFFIPGELELPFMALLFVNVAPYQVMSLRGRQEGEVIAMLIAAYLGFQHFSRANNLRKAFEQGSVVATLAIIATTVNTFLLLI